MATGENVTVIGSWTQTGGQDPNLPVDYFSKAWWWEQRDRRSDAYTLLNHPELMILFSTLYVIFVTWLGPWLMRDRKAFDLKNTLMAYNLFQVILSIYMVIEAWDAGWGRHLSWSKFIFYYDIGGTKIYFHFLVWRKHFNALISFKVCQNVEEGTEPGSPAMRMLAVSYVYMINKYIEFADTFFMVFKKKNNQVHL